MVKTHSSQRGFTLVATALCSAALFGMAGLAIDIGRLYITKNEAQGYADAAALFAARRLDGKAAGLLAADNEVAASTNRWNFGTTPFTGTVVEYSADGLTGWANSAAAAPANMRYVRVTATVDNVSLFFLPVIGTGAAGTVKALAVAGQQVATTVTGGLFPFSPVAHDVGDPNYGFAHNEVYDLKWPQSPTVGNGAKAPCAGDNDQSWVNLVKDAPSQLGYVVFNGASEIVQQILDDNSNISVTVGEYVNPASGDKNAAAKALEDRIAQDNQTALTYEDYIASNHNGRRLITVVVNNGYNDVNGTALPQPAIGVGFAQFLLLPSSSYGQSGGANNAWCAIYVGNDPGYGTTDGGGGGIDGQGVGYIRLTQ